MIAPTLARVVRSTPAVSATSAGPLCRAALGTATKPLQRRYSSSKSSSTPPSNNNNKKKPVEELEQNASTQLRGSGTGKQSHKVSKMPLAGSMNTVPHVPPTTHLHEEDVRLSSFFALHRPIPFHREAWYESTTTEAVKVTSGRLETMRALQETDEGVQEFYRRMYSDTEPEGEKQDAVVVVDEPQQPVGPPTEDSIQYHASQLPHFVPPPPPVAFDPFAPCSKSSTTQDTNPCITDVALPPEQRQRPTAFREHVHRRRGSMLLISVKRQRKLKMKKHKYKKLMKRTRLARRKLDRT